MASSKNCENFSSTWPAEGMRNPAWPYKGFRCLGCFFRHLERGPLANSKLPCEAPEYGVAEQMSVKRPHFSPYQLLRCSPSECADMGCGNSATSLPVSTSTFVGSCSSIRRLVAVVTSRWACCRHAGWRALLQCHGESASSYSKQACIGKLLASHTFQCRLKMIHVYSLHSDCLKSSKAYSINPSRLVLQVGRIRRMQVRFLAR